MSRWFVLKLSMFPTSIFFGSIIRIDMFLGDVGCAWIDGSWWSFKLACCSMLYWDFPETHQGSFRFVKYQHSSRQHFSGPQQWFKKVIPSSFVDLQFESKMNQSTLCCLNTSHIFFLGGVSSRFQPMPKQLWELAPKSHVSGTCVSDHQNCLRMRWKTMAAYAQGCSAQFASTISTSSMCNSLVLYPESPGDELGADVLSGGSKEVDGKNEGGTNCRRFPWCAGWCCR